MVLYFLLWMSLTDIIAFHVEQASVSNSGDLPMNMLGIIQVQRLYHAHNRLKNHYLIFFSGKWQSQKTAELLLDLKVSSLISSPIKACTETAMAISRVSSFFMLLSQDVAKCSLSKLSLKRWRFYFYSS